MKGAAKLIIRQLVLPHKYHCSRDTSGSSRHDCVALAVCLSIRVCVCVCVSVSLSVCVARLLIGHAMATTHASLLSTTQSPQPPCIAASFTSIHHHHLHHRHHHRKFVERRLRWKQQRCIRRIVKIHIRLSSSITDKEAQKEDKLSLNDSGQVVHSTAMLLSLRGTLWYWTKNGDALL